jgi:hypothetical protein
MVYIVWLDIEKLQVESIRLQIDILQIRILQSDVLEIKHPPDQASSKPTSSKSDILQIHILQQHQPLRHCGTQILILLVGCFRVTVFRLRYPGILHALLDVAVLWLFSCCLLPHLIIIEPMSDQPDISLSEGH